MTLAVAPPARPSARAPRGFRPEYPGELATLGWDVLEWLTSHLRSPLDENKSFMPSDEQARRILQAYAIDPRTGRRLYRRVHFEDPKGFGKSPLAAALALFPRGADEELYRSAAVSGREVDSVDSTFVPGPAQAAGLARYHVWRYGDPKLRPTVTDGLVPTRQLTAKVGDHITLTATRYRIDGMRCVIRGISHRFTVPYPFHTEYALEELPTGRDWVQIDGGASDGIDSSAVLAP